MKKGVSFINNKSKYFMKLSLFWFLAPVPMVALSEETSIVTYILLGVSLIFIPYLLMNLMLWKNLSKYMRKEVEKDNLRFYNAIKTAKKLGLQKAYCRSVDVWLTVSIIGVITSGIVVKIGYTRWNF